MKSIKSEAILLKDPNGVVTMITAGRRPADSKPSPHIVPEGVALYANSWLRIVRPLWGRDSACAIYPQVSGPAVNNVKTPLGSSLRLVRTLLLLLSLVLTGCSKEDSAPLAGGIGIVPENPSEKEPNPTPQPSKTAMEYAMELGIGWNLGNSFDAHSNGKSSETCWGNGKATQATFDKVKAMGFSSVRIPVTWMGHIGAKPGYQIEKAWLDRVAEVAGYAKKAGLKAIINIHHDASAGNSNGVVSISQGVWLKMTDALNSTSVNDEMKTEITKVWTQIADRFKDEGEWLMFETFNEPHDGFWGWPMKAGLYSILNQWNQTALNAIRLAGGKNGDRFVGIPCYAANPSFANSSFKLPTDSAKDRLLVSVHCYDPYDYAGAGNKDEWGHTSNVADAAYRESAINTTLNTLQTNFIKKGIPVYVGEFGCVHRSSARAEAFRKYYLEYNIKNMREHNMPVMIWDNGGAGSGSEKFGLVNHATGAYIKHPDINDSQEIVALIVKAWTDNSPGYTLQSIYNHAP